MIENSIYRGNSNLKKQGVVISWTPEMILEYNKCSEDPIYFIEKYMKVINLDEGLVLFNLRDYQKEIINAISDRPNVVICAARQSGKSLTLCGFILWYILFNSEKTVALLANKSATAREIMGKIQIAYQYLPKFLMQGIREWNKGSIELENNSRVIAESTTSQSLRGRSINLLMIDEAAYIENFQEFFASVYPTISSGKTTKIVLVSTPHGMNSYYDIWSGAKAGLNDYYPIEVTWTRVPGRDEEWKRKTLSSLNYNYEMFRIEYECEFIGSSGTLIAGDALKRLQQSTQLPEITLEEGSLKVFEQPIKEVKEDKKIISPAHIYAMVSDVSRGKGLDYSAFTVFDITKIPYRQVCTYRNNEISPTDYTEIIHRVGRIYNNAHVLVEINDIGEQIGTMLLDEYGYENLICSESAGRAGKKACYYTKKSDRGIRTSAPVKNSGCLLLKLLIEQNKLLIADHETVNELTTFSKIKNSYQAEKGKHDDMVMTLVLFAWLSDQKLFEEITEINTFGSFGEKKSEEFDEEFLPAFGVMAAHDYFPPGSAYDIQKVNNMNLPFNPYFIGGYAPEATVVPNF